MGHDEESVTTGAGGPGHIASEARKQRRMLVFCSLPLLDSIQDCSPWSETTHIQRGSFQWKLSRSFLPGTCRDVSVVLNPFRLTVRVACHGGRKGKSSQACEASIKQVTCQRSCQTKDLSTAAASPFCLPGATTERYILFTISIQDHFQKLCSVS